MCKNVFTNLTSCSLTWNQFYFEGILSRKRSNIDALKLGPEVMTFIQDLSDFCQVLCQPLPLSETEPEVFCRSLERQSLMRCFLPIGQNQDPCHSSQVKVEHIGLKIPERVTIQNQRSHEKDNLRILGLPTRQD